MPRQILANWQEYATIKNWKKGLKYNSHSNRLSVQTAHAINVWMPQFIAYTQKNPDEIIEEALAGKHVVKERLSDFCTWLQDVKHRKLNNAVHGSYHIIRGFYSHNEINTQKIRTPKIDPSEVQFSDDRVPLFEVKEIVKDGKTTKRKVIKRDFIQKFFSCLSNRDKIIAMCIKDSGLDSGDILKLPLSIIRYQDPSQERIFIRSKRSKTGEIISTFFTRETTKYVKEYERVNRKNAEDNESIFIQSAKEFKIDFFKKNKRKFNPDVDELKYNPMNPHALAKYFRTATMDLEKQLGIKILERLKQNPLRPKRFRKLFNDACNDAGIPTDIKRVFMGKKDPSNKPYEGKARIDLELFYEKVEPVLSIYSKPVDDIDYEKMRIEYEEKIEDVKRDTAKQLRNRDYNYVSVDDLDRLVKEKLDEFKKQLGT